MASMSMSPARCTWGCGKANAAYECGGETLGDDRAELGAERMDLGAGGGAIMPSWPIFAAIACCCPCTCCCPLFPRLEFGLLCILECRVSSSLRENFLLHPGNWHA